jgi:hypothetical protein
MLTWSETSLQWRSLQFNCSAVSRLHHTHGKAWTSISSRRKVSTSRWSLLAKTPSALIKWHESWDNFNITKVLIKFNRVDKFHIEGPDNSCLVVAEVDTGSSHSMQRAISVTPLTWTPALIIHSKLLEVVLALVTKLPLEPILSVTITMEPTPSSRRWPDGLPEPWRLRCRYHCDF